MSKVLKDVVAVQSPQTGILGHLTWYSLAEMLITPDELRQKLISSGLGDGWMPKDIRLPDAFRRATADKFRRRVSDDVYENFLFREVASDKTMVQRNLVCETVDTKGRRLDYNGAAATLVLDKNNAQVTISHTQAMADQLAQEAVTRFHIFRDNYGVQTIRSMLTNVLKSMSPTPVRPSGGVYFIPQKFDQQLDALMKLVHSLDKGEAEKVPLVNTKDMKGMITRKLYDHLQSTLAACENGVANQLPKSQLKEILDDAKRVVEDYKQYSAIVAGDLKNMEALVVSIREKVTDALANMAV